MFLGRILFCTAASISTELALQTSAFLPLGIASNLRLRSIDGCRNDHPLQMVWGNDEEQDIEALTEEARIKVLEGRRGQIRTVLKAAEGLKNFRIKNGYVPELDEDGNIVKSDSKGAVTLTAFIVAAGAVVLRVGGRAALISGLGLDFANDNPELKDQMEHILNYSDSLDPLTKGALFVAAWTAVKVFCFDAGGVVLALSAGILFGGVLQGAAFSAFAATVGSSVAFALAKMDTPVRKKALEIVDEYPSLRGIERVVARDGLKAILTLRLAPVLPIPIGMYNYVYGVTNVPYLDFAGGIFLGSLKPYLLDSYLGFFGKTLVDGTASSDPTGMQDVILLVALGVSVLIGVFASQLAGETWDSVLQEMEAEEDHDDEAEDEDDGIVREVMGMNLPMWLVGFQLALAQASERVESVVEDEFEAKVWNYTEAQGGPPAELDPAYWPNSPEVSGAGKGFDFAASICDGLVLSPTLFGAFMKYADPVFDESKDNDQGQKKLKAGVAATQSISISEPEAVPVESKSREEMERKLETLRSRTQQKLDEIDLRLKDLL